MLVGINSLRLVITSRLNNKAVICVDIPCFIAGMMARTNPIYISSSSASSNGISVILRSRRQGKIHEMGDRGLAPSTIGISHRSGFRHRILIRELWSSGIFVLLLATLVVSAERVNRNRVARRTPRTGVKARRYDLLSLLLLSRRMSVRRRYIERFPARSRRVRWSRSHCSCCLDSSKESSGTQTMKCPVQIPRDV